ncbi:MAG TPA: hypothetical protein ENK82_08300, partial [Campylobacterales bacterium]|nr:hypothetical protein [Campylobacterales bacterium]
MKKILLNLAIVLMLMGCETGVKSQEKSNEAVLSGIIDKNTVSETYPSTIAKTSKQHRSNKIFSKAIQPGYYLQYAFFAKNKPSDSFLQPILD